MQLTLPLRRISNKSLHFASKQEPNSLPSLKLKSPSFRNILSQQIDSEGKHYAAGVVKEVSFGILIAFLPVKLNDSTSDYRLKLDSFPWWSQDKQLGKD